MEYRTPDPNHGVIRGSTVERTKQAVMVDCSQRTEGSDQGGLSVIPMMDADTVAGLEIRCSCGSTAILECVYPTSPEDPS